MKVALLFFGQLRWVDNPHTHTSFKQFILDKYDTDVFGNFWIPEKSKMLSHSGHTNAPAAPSDQESPEKIQKQYNFTSIRFDEPRDFPFKEKLLERAQARPWPEIHTPGWFSLNTFNNILSHAYSIQRSCRLFRDYMENNLDKSYDFVMLSRNDLCIWDFPDLNQLEKGRFYLSNHHYKFPDLFFIFDVKFLNTFAYLYDNIVKITDDELYSLWEPNAEALKFNSFRRYYTNDHLRPIPLPVRVVRDIDCRGPRW